MGIVPRAVRFDLPAFGRGVYDALSMRALRERCSDWAWAVRWHVGGRMVIWGAWYIMPGTTARTALCVRISEWSRETERRIQEHRAQALKDEAKRIVETWQT